MSDLRNKLDKLSAKKPSKWLEEADYRIKNRYWLKLSQRIAIRILSKMHETPKITKEEWAVKFKIKPKKLEKILKGQSNLKLKTIGKISKVLKIEIGRA